MCRMTGFSVRSPNEDYDGQSLLWEKDRFKMEMPISGCKGFPVV